MLHDVMEIDTLRQDVAEFASIVDHQLAYGDDAGLDDAHLGETSLNDDGLGAELQKTYADSLLTALATMAVRSKRRQADLSAALRRSGLDVDPVRVTEALQHLESTGCIEHLVPLYDGGVLMSVTSRGVEQLNSAPRWTILGISRTNRG